MRGSAPHYSLLKVTRHLLSDGTCAEGHWEQREQEAGQEGRAVPGSPGPSLVSHQAAGVTTSSLERGPAGAVHLDLPVTCARGTWKMPGQRHLLYAP